MLVFGLSAFVVEGTDLTNLPKEYIGMVTAKVKCRNPVLTGEEQSGKTESVGFQEAGVEGLSSGWPIQSPPFRVLR